MRSHPTLFVTALLLAASPLLADDLPVVQLTKDNTRIDRSCVVEIPAGTVIADTDDNGVIQIAADDITVRFAEGSSLVGAKDDVTPDRFKGLGIRLKGHKNVTLENARVHGYRAGLYATAAPGLTLAGGDYSNNYHPHLTSTPQREGSGDWLSPHRNDNNEWLNNYSAAIYIEDSDGVTIHDVRIRQGQHGILLDRVNDSKLYDNDASFLTGWGLGLWRSSRNTITRNAFDFCVRGHSEGVYNRGQDSAGILFFEQCNENIIAENSATHGGDGFFGFAGLEALGTAETKNPSLDYNRVGCNDNIFLRNDLSYAPGHGLEMTFSFGNIIADNRFVENAICGVWGGFSQETLIIHNEFKGNGGMAYGLERGGVNIEHSINNVVVDNTFENNRVGVALWWDNPGDVNNWAWGRNYGPLVGNVIARNTFLISDAPQPFYRVGPDEKRIGVQLRDDSNSGKLAPVLMLDNVFKVAGSRGVDIQKLNGTQTTTQGDVPSVTVPEVEILGNTTPVGARAHLRGRQNIIMGEWGPWDHEGVFLRAVEQSASRRVFDVLGLEGELTVQVEGEGVAATVTDSDTTPGAKRVTLKSEPGAHRYTATLAAGDWSHTVTGTLLSAKWQVIAFNWPKDTADPRENLDRWQAAAKGSGAVSFTTDALSFPFGMGSPSNLDVAPALTAAKLAPDQFGLIARTRMPLTAGKWRLTTQSDDGVRVSVDGKTVIDNWTWHVPTTDTAELNIDRNKTVEIELHYFELDGGATLSLDLERIE